MQTNDLFSVLPLYDANIEAEERTIVNQGGTSSGKTYSIMQVLFTLGMSESRQVITVVGQDIPNLKVGSYRDAKTILDNSPLLRMWWPDINEGERIIKKPSHVEWDMDAAEKGGYPHFMIKEIHEQPKGLTDTMRPRIVKDGKGATAH